MCVKIVRSKMNDVTRLFVVVLVSVMGRPGGTEQSSNYCIGNQCFWLISDPGDFSAAEGQCEHHGGHLMTLRSSVSHDTLSMLVGNLTGRFWIGLHRKSGCPDTSAGLRGFSWVTEDEESDFFNWAPGLDSSCSAPRCVSVSKESDFKWIQEPCGGRAAGFLCEYSFTEPCKSLAVEGGCEHKCCHNTPGSYFCSCYDGYQVDPHSPNKCRLYCGKPECPALCDPNNAFQCYCPDGYVIEERVDGQVCLDFNECVSNFCDQLCTNTLGSYVCSCSDGYRLEGQYQCVKVDDGETDGSTVTPAASTAYIPEPTRQPSGVSVGAFVGIILCTVFFIVLVVFLVHHMLNRRGKMESSGALKEKEDEAHSLHCVSSDA
uniref:Thrombomodulin n=1 Tax=Echeneis naucrates TaxID=173247 RepID=A0A665WGE2_ECHNA